MTGLAQILQLVEEHAERTFLVDAVGGTERTYMGFHRSALAAAKRLEDEGVRPGGRVAFLAKDTAACATLYFACLYAGAVATPVSPTLHAREIEQLLRLARPALLVVEGSLGDDVWSAERRLSLADVVTDQPSAGDPATVPTPREDETFCLMFTSGTTGIPKGVVHRLDRLLGAARAFNEVVALGRDHRMLHVFPPTYMAGLLNTILCPFVAGGSVVAAPLFDAASMLRFWDLAERHGADTLWLAPTMLAALLRVDRGTRGEEYCRRHVERLCVGTAPLPARVRYDFEDRYGVTVLESYGLSELLFVSATPPSGSRDTGSVGRPLAGVQARVVDCDGTVLGTAEEGELEVRTAYRMSGYLDTATNLPDPASAAEWFPTGDVARLEPEGCLYITGRKKDLIVRGGLNISPRAVEDILSAHEAVREVAVIGLPHHFYGEEVVAVLRLEDGRSLEQETLALLAHCRRHLGPPAVPARFVAVEELPVSSSGKVRKDRLRELVSSGG